MPASAAVGETADSGAVSWRNGRGGRSSIGLSAALILTAMLAGCGPSKIEQLKAENRELHDKVDQLETKLSDVQEKATALETASDNLKEQLGRFQSEDWRDVVPDAQDPGEEVDKAKDDLKQAVDE